MKSVKVELTDTPFKGGTPWSVEKARTNLAKHIKAAINGSDNKKNRGCKVKVSDDSCQVTLMANGVRVGDFINFPSDMRKQGLVEIEMSVLDGHLDSELIENHTEAVKRRRKAQR